MESIRRVMQSTFKCFHNKFQFCVSFKAFFFTSGLLVKRKWQNLRENFRREHAKISNRTTGSEAPAIPHYLLGNITNSF